MFSSNAARKLAGIVLADPEDVLSFNRKAIEAFKAMDQPNTAIVFTRDLMFMVCLFIAAAFIGLMHPTTGRRLIIGVFGFFVVWIFAKLDVQLTSPIVLAFIGLVAVIRGEFVEEPTALRQ